MSMIKVTTPLLPDLDELHELLKEVWEREMITNCGPLHERLENELSRYLKVPHLSLYANGTLPLLAAIRILGLTGEVITTPYSFIATSHAIWWSGLKPVFVDVDPATGCIDPDKIEEAVTPRTSAIMAVHVYGNVCDTARIEEIARRHSLKVIYDAAHAFGVERDGRSILTEGDISTLSFHATKVYNTVEGGALVTRSSQIKDTADLMRNFGYEDEVTISEVGINSKMDEIRAAYGLITLRKVQDAIARRQQVASRYRETLAGIEGIRLPDEQKGIRSNYSYFPIFVESCYGMSRDELYEKMKSGGVYGRRYFYPLITDFHPYSELPSARPDYLPAARKLADSVICLPIHHQLTESDIDKVIRLIRP
ncbi:MAG: DegT/DnrJ/EryC1/StrS family aminotransferase [Bacteroidales bacterium]|nr:DegT/DnrJ/EryC1/StrS family aminotransferase [Bacteroidales bacterium]